MIHLKESGDNPFKNFEYNPNPNNNSKLQQHVSSDTRRTIKLRIIPNLTYNKGMVQPSTNKASRYS